MVLSSSVLECFGIDYLAVAFGIKIFQDSFLEITATFIEGMS
jgi:hypothetical protein